MLTTIITHGLAFLAGVGAASFYLHKHTASAIAAAAALATAVDGLKNEVKKA